MKTKNIAYNIGYKLQGFLMESWLNVNTLNCDINVAASALTQYY